MGNVMEAQRIGRSQVRRQVWRQAQLTVTFDPPIGENEFLTSVRADGLFRLEVDLQDGDFYEGTMLVSGQDACGSITSATVPVRFDAVTSLKHCNSSRQ